MLTKFDSLFCRHFFTSHSLVEHSMKPPLKKKTFSNLWL